MDSRATRDGKTREGLSSKAGDAVWPWLPLCDNLNVTCLINARKLNAWIPVGGCLGITRRYSGLAVGGMSLEAGFEILASSLFFLLVVKVVNS